MRTINIGTEVVAGNAGELLREQAFATFSGQLLGLVEPAPYGRLRAAEGVGHGLIACEVRADLHQGLIAGECFRHDAIYTNLNK